MVLFYSNLLIITTGCTKQRLFSDTVFFQVCIICKNYIFLHRKILLFETHFLCTLSFTSDFCIFNTQISVNCTFILPNTVANLQSEQLQQCHLLEVSDVQLLFLVDSYEISIVKDVFCCLLLAFCFVQSSVLGLHFYLLLQFYL